MAYRMIVLIKNWYGDGGHQSVSSEFVLSAGSIIQNCYVQVFRRYGPLLGFSFGDFAD